MDNPTGGVNDNIGARAEVVGRTADLPRGFRNQAILATVGLAVLAGATWFFLAGPSDREVIDDRLADLGITATYIGEAADDDGYLFTVDRACGDQIPVTIEVGEAQLDAPRRVTIDEGSRAVIANEETVASLLNCEN